MDFSSIFQTRDRKYWWMDVIFYFVMSLLVAAIFCYLAFFIKNKMINSQIDALNVSMQKVGTDIQKKQEKDVIDYQKKIAVFSSLLKSQKFSSNVFAFMRGVTMPNVWFKQFGLDGKNSKVQLSGEADSIDVLSRQVAVLEENKYVEKIAVLNSSLGALGRVLFNINLSLDQNIFDYISSSSEIVVAQTGQLSQQPKESPVNIVGANTSEEGQQNSLAKSSEKKIDSFKFLLSPEVVGSIDQENFIITASVPFGTSISNLAPLIAISPKATVSPASGVSQDFTNPVSYIVIAEDSSAQNYEVRINVNSQPVVNNKSNQSKYIIIIIIALIVVVVISIVFLLIRKNRK